MKSTTLKIVLLSIFSGVLLHFGWPNNYIFPLLFVGFVPLLFALEYLSEGGSRYSILKAFLLTFTTYAIWQLLSLTWLYEASADSYVVSVVLISVNYSFFLAFYPLVRRKLGRNYGLAYFACALVLADYVSQVSLLSSPYCNVSIGLGMAPWLIQHYKWIGIEGGSLWILVCNALIYKMIAEKAYAVKKLIPLMCLMIAIPILSIVVYNIPDDVKERSAVVALHHSAIDPQSREAFENPIGVVDALFSNTFNNLEELPDVVVWPENIIVRLGWLHKLDSEPVIMHLKNKLKSYPNTTVVLGAVGFSEAKGDVIDSRYTTYEPEGNYYYSTHNVAVTVGAGRKTSVRSKEKFIPFHERIPYINTLPFLTSLVDQVGLNAMFSVYKGGRSLAADMQGNKYESILCYETMFPLFMIKKSTKKIGAFLIHANERWLEDPSGSEQYLYVNAPTAIQGGKPLLRSSNSGISCIIDTKGNILSPVYGKVNDNITSRVKLNYGTTFYSKIAGLFYSGSGIMSVLLGFISIVKTVKKQ